MSLECHPTDWSEMFGMRVQLAKDRGVDQETDGDQTLKICERFSLTSFADIRTAAEDRNAWRALLHGLTPRDPHGNAPTNR